MAEVDKRITRDVSKYMADEIEDAGGNEVFFTGTLNGEGLLAEVTVASRGHESAVPVIQSAVENAEVLIHNHPSGNLQPSDADLEIASHVAENGLGFYIVNNTVTLGVCGG